MEIILQIIIVLSVIFFSMTFHELMHGLTAHWLGDDTPQMEGRLTLNPIKHIDLYLTIILPVMLVITSFITGGATPIFGGAKPVPFNPNRLKYGEWGSALVAISGPLTNFILAFIFFGTIQIFNLTDGIAHQFLLTAVIVNLGFFVFNMIPIPPLDGSRVLYLLAPDSVRNIMNSIERFGIIFVFLIILMTGSMISIFISWSIANILNLFQIVFQ